MRILQPSATRQLLAAVRLTSFPERGETQEGPMFTARGSLLSRRPRLETDRYLTGAVIAPVAGGGGHGDFHTMA